MSERLHPGSGYAIIAEFTYPSREDHSHAQNVRQYNLNQGEGVIFTGNNDNPGDVIRFQQSEIESALGRVILGQLQIMAMVDMTTGSLFITDGSPDNSIGLNGDVPLEPKVMVIDYGRISFAAVWGENEEIANTTLHQVQEERMRMN